MKINTVLIRLLKFSANFKKIEWPENDSIQLQSLINSYCYAEIILCLRVVLPFAIKQSEQTAIAKLWLGGVPRWSARKKEKAQEMNYLTASALEWRRDFYD